LDYLLDGVAACPWSATAGSPAPLHRPEISQQVPLYTPEQRRRRDATKWTMVQGILAPFQFLVFLISLTLVLNYLASGNGYQIAAASVIVKTIVLYAIMITGAVWEKKVFGRYLFAPSFFWEDAFSMLVIALHTAYLLAMLENWGSPNDRMLLALTAYLTYAINATQFILKFRAARLEAPDAYAKAAR
jgi:3-vinyl bacteriochlorophyllide hydratase